MWQTFLAMRPVQLPFYLLLILSLLAEKPEAADQEDQADQGDRANQTEKSEETKEAHEEDVAAAAAEKELNNDPNPFDEAAEILELRRKIREFCNEN